MKAEKILIELLSDKRHIVIMGQTRAGKTTVAKKLAVLALRLGYKIFIIDWRNEYDIGLVSLPFIVPKKTLPSLLATIVAEESRTAGSLTWMALNNIINSSTTFNNLINNLLIQVTDRDLRLGAIAALARLKPLLELNPEFYDNIQDMPSGRWDLSHLDYYTQKNAANLVTAALYESLKSQPPLTERTLVILEEAHHYLPGLQLIREGAFYGLKLIEVLQSPTENSDLLINSNLVVFNLGSEAKRIILQRAWHPTILKLREYEFTVYSCQRRRWIGPLKLKKVK